MILLWLAGGPSQFETFSPKPGTEPGGPTAAIETAVPGVRVAEHWPRVAAALDRFAVVRSMTGKEADHTRASYQSHTGFRPVPSVRHPGFGARVVHQRNRAGGDLPGSVAVGSAFRTDEGRSATFLGTAYDPMKMRTAGRLPDEMRPSTTADELRRRDALRRDLQQALAVGDTSGHDGLYDAAINLTLSKRLDAFSVEGEPRSVRTAYGETPFGDGCLMARRLVERGVTFVEVVSDGWDTHADGFGRVASLAPPVDRAVAALVDDLEARGMLEKTLVVVAGEFGRTPKITNAAGRNHFPKAYNVLLAGGGVRGGQVIGETSAGGHEVTDRPVTITDLLRSCCHSLGIDADREIWSPSGRPFKTVDDGAVVTELFS